MDKGIKIFLLTYLLFGFMFLVNGLMYIAVIGIVFFTSNLIIRWLLTPPPEDGKKISAEALCNCSLKV
jgi:hypothetical protein